MSDEKLTKCEDVEGSSSIVLSTMFSLTNPGEYSEKYHYSRYGNPSRNVLEESLARLDMANFALTYSSKMAATLAILSTLKADDLMISSDFLLCEKIKKLGVRGNIEHFEFYDVRKFEESFNVNTKIVWIESLCFPFMTALDIKSISDVIHEKSKAVLVVDNTVLTPYFLCPLKLGADIVIYSLDEFIAGHSDVKMGSVATNDRNLYEKLKYHQTSNGVGPSPFDCFIVNRSLKTFPLRMERYADNAKNVARFLESNSKIKKVFFEPGSGVLSFILKGYLEDLVKFSESLKYISISEVLGGVETTIDLRWMKENLIIVSVGLESFEKIKDDFDQALGKILT
ncbi:CLUMA_CG008839, isoform A [Clunio marinus]|uniref:cystathionine gamma-lyase n=1 Tax=Clunio marinus TaxID=568069 RepID=A0A1J1I4N4_9DIPT|nr:CLUMA_CG008839, isoform A [Clunio marinus]